MYSRRRIVLSCLLACATAHAWAQSGAGAFNVGAVVLPARPSAQVQADFPVPAQARQLTTQRFGGSWLCHGDLAATAAYYRDAMPERGYRMVSDESREDFVRQHWERGADRVEIRLQPVLGDDNTVRMIVVAGQSRTG
jgi:hypothetical protein